MIWNNEVYKTIFDKVNDAIFIHPLQKSGFAKFIAVNEVAIKRYGYTEKEFLNLTAKDITKQEDAMQHSQEVNRKDLLIKRSKVFETTHYTKGGREIPVEISSNIVEIEGKPFFIALVRDISERIESQRAIHENRNKYQKIFHNTPDGIILTDFEGKFIEVNPGMEIISGYKPEYLINKKDTDFKMWVYNQEREDYILAMKQKGYARNNECRFRLKSGEIGVGLISGEVVEIDGKQYILSIIRDITERKRIFNELQQANENIKATLSAIPDLMFESDINGIIYDFHIPEHRETYLESKALLGKSIRDIFPPEASSIIISAIKEANKKGWHLGASYSLQINNKRKWFDLSISVKQNNNSSENRYILLVRDVSGRKLIEEMLQQQNIEYQNLNNELSDTLARLSILNEELTEAKMKAEESDRLKTAFLGNISHEVRTPMNGITGFIELLKLNSTLSDREEKYITIIEKSSKRLLKIINNIIEIAKLESGNIIVQHKTFDLEKLFKELYTDYIEKADQRRIYLKHEIRLNNNQYSVLSDKFIIKRILENLLDNSFKYTFEGEILFGCMADKEELLFYVSDTGEGIRETDMNKIFDQFVQGEQVFSNINSGAGLGLSISRAYIDALGGRIWVESESGKGSTFYFIVPVSPDDKHNTRIEQPKFSSARSKKE